MAFEAEAKLGGPRRTRALLLVVATLLAIAWVGSRAAFHAPGVIALLAVFGGMGATASLSRPTQPPSRKSRRVRVDARGLIVDGALALGRSDISGALVVETEGGGAVVHLDTRRPWHFRSVFVASLAEAHALVEAVGLGHPDDLVRIRALPPWAKHIRWLAVLLTTSPWILFNFVRWIPFWGLGVLALLYGVVALPLVMPQLVEVGSDGVLVTWLGRRRFLPYRAIAHATASPLGVDLTTTDGRDVEIRLTQRDGEANAKRDALLARIETGILRHREARRSDEEALLARGGRTVDAWVDAMRALGAADAGGYRSAAVPRERLWQLLEDATTDPSAREGAAIALHAASAEDGEARARLAELASRTAAPRLRVALTALGALAPDEAHVRVAVAAAEATESEDDLTEHAGDEPPDAADARHRREAHR